VNRNKNPDEMMKNSSAEEKPAKPSKDLEAQSKKRIA